MPDIDIDSRSRVYGAGGVIVDSSGVIIRGYKTEGIDEIGKLD